MSLCRPPLVVCAGIGRDSTGMLVGMSERRIRPDLVVFGDTGGEKPETYDYIPVLNDWLRSVGFPELTIVRSTSNDQTLYDNAVRLNVLPSIAFNFGACSDRWKQAPQRRFLNHWQPARDAWKGGAKVIKAVGFEASETNRLRRGTYRIPKDRKFRNWFPLFEWGWDLGDCLDAILRAGLPVPMKSACYFCPVSKLHEIEWLAARHPDLLVKVLVMERLAIFRTKPPRPVKIKGLGGRKFAWSDLEVCQPFIAEADAIIKRDGLVRV